MSASARPSGTTSIADSTLVSAVDAPSVVPLFAEPVWTGTPNRIDRVALHARIEGALDRNRLTNGGPLVEELEERLAERCGAHVVAVSTGTSALLVAARALGVSGKVAVPSWTFVATVHAIRLLGAEPVFVDVGADHLMDPRRLSEVAERVELGGILPVHLFGQACDLDALGLVAAGLDVPLLYDAAQVLGTTVEGRPVPATGDAAAISLHATKWISAVEGGAVVTADGALAEECRRLRNFGMGPSGISEQVGTNAKMSEFHAAAGLTALERWDELVEVNTERFATYEAVLRDVPGVRVLDTGAHDTTARPYVVVDIDDDGTGRRDRVQEGLRAANVFARAYFRPGAHRLAPYADLHPPLPLPVTERLADTALALPTGDAITVTDARRIAELLTQLATAGPAVERDDDEHR